MSLGKKKMLSQGAAGGLVARDNFNPVLYTGSGNNQTITSVGFDSDFTWTKTRSEAQHNWLFDTVRGNGIYLSSDRTDADITVWSAFGVHFDTSNGFTVKDDSNGGFSVNKPNATYVAWNWKAGGAKASNTNGTIASEVSANVDAGFSIVSFTSNGVGSPVSTGHGLSSVPELVIFKNRDDTSQWPVFHKDIGFNGRLQLESNASVSTFTPFFDMTTTTIAIRQSSLAINGDKCIAYCFHSVDGYSKIGSYTGTGGAGNPIVTGFKPAWIMIKGTHNVDWWIADNKINSSDNITQWLKANDTSSVTTLDILNFTSSGFNFTREYLNETNNSFIYMAFA